MIYNNFSFNLSPPPLISQIPINSGSKVKKISNARTKNKAVLKFSKKTLEKYNYWFLPEIAVRRIPLPCWPDNVLAIRCCTLSLTANQSKVLHEIQRCSLVLTQQNVPVHSHEVDLCWGRGGCHSDIYKSRILKMEKKRYSDDLNNGNML